MTKNEIAFSNLKPVAAGASVQVVHGVSASTQDETTQRRMVRLLNDSQRIIALGPSATVSQLEYIASVLQEAIRIADSYDEKEEDQGQRHE